MFTEVKPVYQVMWLNQYVRNIERRATKKDSLKNEENSFKDVFERIKSSAK